VPFGFASLHSFAVICLFASSVQVDARGVLAVQTQTDTAEQHIAQARAALAREDYREARKQVNRALSLSKDSSEAHFLRARINRFEGKLDDAVKDVKEALRSNPDYLEAHTEYARLLFEAGQEEEGRRQLEKALSYNPPDPNSFMLKGELDIRDRKYDSAMESFAEVIRFAPRGDPGISKIRTLLDAIKNLVAHSASPVAEPGNTRPIPLNRPMPSYTEKARASRTQGIVNLALVVSENGDVTHSIVISGLKDGLTGEAIRAARKIRFKPALRAGSAVPFLQLIEVEFNIRRGP
jgi:TonB family protein